MNARIKIRIEYHLPEGFCISEAEITPEMMAATNGEAFVLMCKDALESCKITAAHHATESEGGEL